MTDRQRHQPTPETVPKQPLDLSFHGRIMDSLRIQIYESPVAAIAELIANTWDADAVDATLPRSVSGTAEFVVEDKRPRHDLRGMPGQIPEGGEELPYRRR